MFALALAIVFCCSFLPLARTNWMYLGVVGAWQGPQQEGVLSEQGASPCGGVPGLVGRQMRVCRAHPSLIRAVGGGARQGIRECQQQFRHDRWNCSLEGGESVFDHTLQRGSRETAFVHAITSAGATHAVTQACSAGNLTDCSCDATRQGRATAEGWKWGGCSDNVRYGVLFARQFVDAPERQRRRDERALMNLHNNNAGRLAIIRQMELKCRCHGVSGSCELKTCWNKLPPFESVGLALKRKYDASVQVSANRRRLRRRGKVKRKVPVQKEELVHLYRSPDFCVEDPKKGILGTSGRPCNRTAPPNHHSSCQLLCCGRGYNTQVIRRLERCHCKFQWCCFVKCKTCETMEEIYTCK